MRTWCLLMVLLLLPLWTSAQAEHVDIEKRLTAEQRRATGLDALSSKQLELLNHLLREQTTPIAPLPESKSTAPPAPRPEPEAASVAVARTEAASVTVAKAEEPMFIGLNDRPIKTRIKGTLSGWAPGTEFVLENGQRWKVLKGTISLRAPLEDPAVVVLPGIAGRWFLQVDESLPSARVYRIQ